MSLFKSEIATREKVKLMLGFSGPSGSGKTLSALYLAYGITKDWIVYLLLLILNFQ